MKIRETENKNARSRSPPHLIIVNLINPRQRRQKLDVRKTIRHKTHRQVHRVASSNKTHGSEVDPTGIEGLSNFSLVVDLVKRIKIWLRDL